MPIPVVLAATLQLLLAATFVVLPVTVLRRGPAAQRAAEAEVRRQGAPPEALTRCGIGFIEKAWEFVLALGIAALLATLAGLNLAGSGAGRLLSWVVEPLVLVAVGLVCAGQVFAARYTRAAFARADEPAVRALDASAVVGAAAGALPSWVRPVVLLRFGLVVLGSPLVIVLLALPAAGRHFA
ncbi:hypothetical protein [Actinophytocola xanthii]|uniref:Uncharacterized protein n=1 Tax=Actinophytocola xanthii TaxID=1912961 RepID=A0A1Q8CVM1_9PSEU|nr:hypothetical protein [Actinophytocola xanthii]OLF18374.1 hypothetical protein BU204_07515 [Actinophytocola xanthii]